MNKLADYKTYSGAGDTGLITSHLPLVKRIAHHLAVKLPPSIEVEDLVQVGLIGLLKAVEDYQSDSGAAFTTYATIRVRGAIMDELRSRDWLPRSVQKNLGRVSSAVQVLEQRLGRVPSEAQIARELGVTIDEYRDILTDVSFARLAPVEDIESVSGDFEPEREVTDDLRSAALAEAITELPEKEQLMMSMYYAESMNLKEIGLVLNVSESRVSQIHGQAIARLKGKLKDWS